MLLGRQPDNTDDTIACGVVVDLNLNILSEILLRYLRLVLTEIESVVSSSSYGVTRRHGRRRDAEKGQRSAERRQRVRHSVEERARAAPGERGQVECLGTPGGVTSKRGVVLEFDGEGRCGRCSGTA